MEQITKQYFDVYKNSGFYFSKSLLTTYALSLKSKPFVILSGISGTGKTKISQLFTIPEATITNHSNTLVDLLTLRITPSLDRVNFPIETLNLFLNEDEIKEWDEQVEEAKKSGSAKNFSKTYIINIQDEFGNFQIGIYGQRASSPLLRVRFKKSSRDTESPDYNATEHIRRHYNPGDILSLQKIGEKDFKVRSLNDEPAKLAQTNLELKTIDRHCFIPVKSNWTDNTELLGYFNLIERKYHIPKFLDFILLANDYPEYSFFATFDEMNLSKVEHYFSDILSCTESRYIQDGKIKQEPLTLYSGSDYIDTDSDNFEMIPSSIEIPTNLFITGTVNIDESTYSFSNKVLDRANVIEFNEVDLINYEKYTEIDQAKFVLDKFPNYNDFTIPSREHYNSLPPKIKEYLVGINNILKEHNLHFGYRVANEIGLYIKNATECINSILTTAICALDYQLVQKVFPKLNGEYAILEEPIRKILEYLSNSTDINNIQAESTEFPITVGKLLRMYNKLKKTGYTSFIE